MPAQPSQTSDAHHAYVALIGEAIGVTVLAIIADMNDDAGKIVVAIMAGWFLLFLMIQAPVLAQLTGKIGG